MEGTSIPITCSNRGHLWGQTSFLSVLSSPAFYPSKMKSGWPVKAFELPGLGSAGAFRERERERRSDSMSKEHFHEDF